MRINFSFVNEICREPYRLFFPLAIFFGVAGVSHWVFYAQGWIQNYSNFFHSLAQMLGYMTCFILGFLLTALPRFSGTAYATKKEIVFFSAVVSGIFIALELKSWIGAEVFYLICLTGLLRFALVRVIKREKKEAALTPPLEMIFVPVGVAQGIIGTILLILGQLRIFPPWVTLAGKPMMEQGFILSVIMGVGGFLIPRLLGTYQRVMTDKEAQFGRRFLKKDNSLVIYLAAGFCLFVSFWLEPFSSQGAYFLRAMVLSVVFMNTRALAFFFPTQDFYVKLAAVSVWMIVLGFWGVALWPDYRVAMLHIAYIGGLSLMTFAVGTMVIFSHAGEGKTLHDFLWILVIVAIGLILALIKRLQIIMAPPEIYFKILGIAAVFWIVTAVAWLFFMLPRIFRIPLADEFGKMHEEAKASLHKC